MAYKILILGWLADEPAARRELQVRNHPALREHQFDFAYVREGTPWDRTLPMPARLVRSTKRSLDENDLLQRLLMRIDAMPADLLLVQSGPLFHSYPEQALFVMQSVKAARPRVRIGLHTRPFEQMTPKPFFEYSAELGELMAHIF